MQNKYLVICAEKHGAIITGGKSCQRVFRFVSFFDSTAPLVVFTLSAWKEYEIKKMARWEGNDGLK